MSKTTDIQPPKAAGDLVLREVWRAKDTLCAQYGHDLDKLFAETRQREKLSHQAPKSVTQPPLGPTTHIHLVSRALRPKNTPFVPRKSCYLA